MRKGRGLTIRFSGQAVLAALPLLFYLLNDYRMLGHSALPYLAGLSLAGGAGLLELALQRRYNLSPLILLFVLYGVTLLANWLFIKNVSTSDLVVSVLMFGTGVLMTADRWSFRQGAIQCYIVLGALGLRVLRGSVAKIVLTSSSNYVSVLLILACAIYYIGLENDGRCIHLLDLIPAGAGFALAVWARGRGGILSCGVLVALVLILYARSLTGKNAKRLVILLLLLFTMVAGMLVVGFNPMERFFSLGKFASRGASSDDRMVIWGAYLSKATESLPNFLLGGPLSEIPIIMRFEGNCHNSFIQLHAFNGIFMFVVMIGLLVRSGQYYFRSGRWITLAMMLVVCLRGMTDKFIFGQYGMPLVLYFALFPFVERQSGTQAAPADNKRRKPAPGAAGRRIWDEENDGTD